MDTIPPFIFVRISSTIFFFFLFTVSLGTGRSVLQEQQTKVSSEAAYLKIYLVNHNGCQTYDEKCRRNLFGGGTN